MAIMTDRRTFLSGAAALCGGSNLLGQKSPNPTNSQTAEEVAIAHPGQYNIRDEDHFGVINGHITVGVNYRDVAGLGGLYAPPYASTDFVLEMRIDGRPVPTTEYWWTPIEVQRKGRSGDIEVASETVLLQGLRAGILRLTFTNRGGAAADTPLQFNIAGSFDRVEMWGFPRPQTQKKETVATVEANRIVRANSAGAYVVGCDAGSLRWEPWSSHWETRLRIAPGASRVVHVAFAMGSRDDAVKMADAALADPGAALRTARESLRKEWKELYTRLPEFEAEDERLEAYYRRSA